MLVELKTAYNLPHTVNKTSKIKEDLNKGPSLFYKPKGPGPGSSCTGDFDNGNIHHRYLGKHVSEKVVLLQAAS